MVFLYAHLRSNSERDRRTDRQPGHTTSSAEEQWWLYGCVYLIVVVAHHSIIQI